MRLLAAIHFSAIAAKRHKRRKNSMKCTRYFLYTRTRSDRAGIRDEWIEQAIAAPIRTTVQSDGRIRKWTEVDGKYLRVILLEDGETVHNAFFDRNFKEQPS